MTPRTFCQSGKCETTKAVIHGALGVLSAGCFAYNLAAFAWRRKRHLAFNAVVYGALLALEVKQVRHHLTKDA